MTEDKYIERDHLAEGVNREENYLYSPLENVKMSTIFGGLYCVGFIETFGVVAGIRRQKIVLSIGPIRVGST
jgi:hypothetical protein